MTMNIGQTLLHRAEHGDFGFGRQAIEIFRDFNCGLDFAALHKPVDIALRIQAGAARAGEPAPLAGLAGETPTLLS